jgi:hypothetical protein
MPCPSAHPNYILIKKEIGTRIRAEEDLSPGCGDAHSHYSPS